MPTSKQRINITADPEIEQALRLAARREGVPVAAKATELVAIGLSLEEDLTLAELAEERAKTPKKEFVPHAKIWQ